MNAMINNVPATVHPPTKMKIYPILSSPIALIIDGIVALTTKLIIQFRKVATVKALSYIISDMYNQVIGPEENSNKAIKVSKRTISRIF